MRRLSGSVSWAAVLLAVAPLFVSVSATAQERGFQLNRYEPTAPGEYSFMVSNPWYLHVRRLAAGLTFNYGRALLFSPTASGVGNQIISDQFIAHADLAVAFSSRALLSFSLPIVLREAGSPAYGVTPAAGAVVGDPRLSGAVRIAGLPYVDKFSVSASATIWLPLQFFDSVREVFPAQTNDRGFRGLAQLILSGTAVSRRVFWATNLGASVREIAVLDAGAADGTSQAGPEIQLGASLYGQIIGVPSHQVLLGFETLWSTQLAPSTNAFTIGNSAGSLLGGIHWRFWPGLQLSGAYSKGILAALGVPEHRLMLRLSWAPSSELKRPPRRVEAPPVTESNIGTGTFAQILDSDADGYPDTIDKCPNEPAPQGTLHGPRGPGCPFERAAPQPAPEVVSQQPVGPTAAANTPYGETTANAGEPLRTTPSPASSAGKPEHTENRAKPTESSPSTLKPANPKTTPTPVTPKATPKPVLVPVQQPAAPPTPPLASPIFVFDGKKVLVKKGAIFKLDHDPLAHPLIGADDKPVADATTLSPEAVAGLPALVGQLKQRFAKSRQCRLRTTYFVDPRDHAALQSFRANAQELFRKEHSASQGMALTDDEHQKIVMAIFFPLIPYERSRRIEAIGKERASVFTQALIKLGLPAQQLDESSGNKIFRPDLHLQRNLGLSKEQLAAKKGELEKEKSRRGLELTLEGCN